jgi:hypothetical protein
MPHLAEANCTKCRNSRRGALAPLFVSEAEASRGLKPALRVLVEYYAAPGILKDFCLGSWDRVEGLSES